MNVISDYMSSPPQNILPKTTQGNKYAPEILLHIEVIDPNTRKAIETSPEFEVNCKIKQLEHEKEELEHQKLQLELENQSLKKYTRV